LAAAVVAIAVLNATPAQAGANRTFVSVHGDDGSSDCSIIAPCRSFAAAVLLTNAGGEVVVLDPGGYGSATITKAISIINDGVGEAGITDAANGTNAITINAGASDVVNLRGLTLNGVGVGHDGVVFTTGGTLNIQNCVIRGFTDAGIIFQPAVSSTLTVFDTTVANISSPGLGVRLAPNGAGLAVNAYLRRIQVIRGVTGIDVDPSQMQSTGSLMVTVADSLVTGNTIALLLANAPSVSYNVAVIDTQLVNNIEGLLALGGKAAIAGTTMSGNTSRDFFVNSSSAIDSFGNNRITDNNSTGSLTPIAKQ
jgi:hypothetical protein